MNSNFRKELFTTYGCICYSLVCALDAKNKIAEYILEYELSAYNPDGGLEVVESGQTSVEPNRINESLEDLKLNLKNGTLQKFPDYDQRLLNVIPF